MSETIKNLLDSIGTYMEKNVDLMISSRKVLSLLVGICTMILAETMIIAIVVLKILREVK